DYYCYSYRDVNTFLF
nr:immunoglobulin light chain junction region [Macaca mulatta]